MRAGLPHEPDPSLLAAAYSAGDLERAEKLGLLTCMECGCCSYSCPAHRPIVQTMRLAKEALRRERK